MSHDAQTSTTTTTASATTGNYPAASTYPTTVAVIGTGNIGSHIIRRLSNGGVPLVVASSSPDSAQHAIDQLNLVSPRIQVLPVDAAISSASIIVLATPFPVSRELVRKHAENLSGKTIVDPSNNVALQEDGTLVDLNEDASSAASTLVELLADDIAYVKAFGTLSADELGQDQAADGQRAALLFASDDSEATEKLRHIIRRGGWDAAHIGGVDSAERIEVFGDLHTSGNRLQGIPSALEVAQILGTTRSVSTAQELTDAIAAKVSDIEVIGTISGISSITLPAGTTLRGGHLVFSGKGVRLTSDNTLKDITIETREFETAIYNSHELDDAGVIRLENVQTVGQVLITAREALTHLRVEVNGLHVQSADVRGRAEQPHGYGVDVLQGGLTLWNMQPDPTSQIDATLRDIRVGTEDTPVRGSGIFVAGHGDREGRGNGGTFFADLIHVTSVVTDGGIAPATPDKISGGVFVVSGAAVQHVDVTGPVTTHGPNDMVLDLWGEVREWTVSGPVTSTGPSGIGFVNFGTLGNLQVTGPITTHGGGARGFNLYDGSIESASFASIATHGDGAVGIQISKPMGPLTVTGDVTTTGGTGMSLVKGVQMELKATAISLKSGAQLPQLVVSGAVETTGDDLVSVEIDQGAVAEKISFVGGIKAHGADSQTLANGSTIDVEIG